MSAVRTALVLTLALLPGALAAQIPLGFGKAVSGRLTVADQQFSDGSRQKMYAFVGNRGDTVTADLMSDDFDPLVILADASGNPLTRNDDGGENCNARLTWVLPAAANYRLYATSSSKAELGEYQVRIVRGHEAPAADSTCRGFGRMSGLVQVGQSVSGSLTSEDRMFQGDSTFFQVYTLPVEANQTVTVDLESSEFDPFLMLIKGRDTEANRLAQNDDGGGNCNARIVYTASDDHPLRIVANTASVPKRQTGRFTLRVSDGESPIEAKGADCRGRPNAPQADAPAPRERADGPAPVGPARPITVGQAVTGEITSSSVKHSDGTPVEWWQIDGRSGETVTVDMESDDFDAYLLLSGPGSTALSNDDDGGNCNPRITFTFPESGTYRIGANTVSPTARGAYSLTVTRGSRQKSTARCEQSRFH